MDKIRNERIRGTTKVAEISKKAQKRRFQWYGHVMRKEEDCVERRVMDMEVKAEGGGVDQKGDGEIAWREISERKQYLVMNMQNEGNGGDLSKTATPYEDGKS